MIPEFDPLVGRVYHDVFHVYTADVHAVKALEHLQALTRGEGLACIRSLRRGSRQRRPRRLPLFLAVLLHSLGRIRGRDQEEEGARMAESIAIRLGLSASRRAARGAGWCDTRRRSIAGRHSATSTTRRGLTEVVKTRRNARAAARLVSVHRVAIVSTINPEGDDLLEGARSRGPLPLDACRARDG